jgi:hypothetical protein
MTMRAEKRVSGAGGPWRNAACYRSVFISTAGLLLIMLGSTSVHCFQPFALTGVTRQNTLQRSKLHAMVDPSDLSNTLVDWASHHSAVLPLVHHVNPADATHLTTNPNVVSSVLSTILSTEVGTSLQNNDIDHAYPFLRPLSEKLSSYTSDQLEHLTKAQQKEIIGLAPLSFWREYLKAEPGYGDVVKAITQRLKELHEFNVENAISIRPDASAFRDLGLEPHGVTAQDLLPQGEKTIPRYGLFDMFKFHNDIKPLDASMIVRGGDATFPGFATTKSILAPHVEETVRPDSPTSFVARMKGAGAILPVIDKLPQVAFYYAFVEFFFLRRDVDLFKEEVEDDPTGVAAETVSDIAVRVGILFVIAMVTLTFA